MPVHRNHGEANTRSRVSSLALLFLLCLTVGCSESTSGYDEALRYPIRVEPIVIRVPFSTPTELHPPGQRDDMIARFEQEPGGLLSRPETLSQEFRFVLDRLLEEQFGTPAKPKLSDNQLGFTEAQLASGSKLYRVQCAHCHGLTGHGRGPTGHFLEPPPRDFRTGHYKSPAGTPRPSQAALKRVLRQGVNGTQMQAYDLLSESEIDAIIAYMIHLAVRGETETQTILAATDEEQVLSVQELEEFVKESKAKSLAQWSASWDAPLPAAQPISDAAAILRGYDLAKRAGCFSCHPSDAKQEAYRYDLWGNVLRVPRLTNASWKWGSEPGDLYSRVKYGIAAANMPANPAYNERQLLDLTEFLRVIGRPDLLPEELRKELYAP